MPIQLDTYFQRIGYHETKPDVSLTTLKNIHSAQVLTIPFENLAIHDQKNANVDKLIPLDEDSLFKKLVLEKRGGYCHENNELLALVLTQLGFTVDRLAARVLTAPNLPITHKLLMITLHDQQWIADVGFGVHGLYEPLPLIPNQISEQYGTFYQLTLENDLYTLQAKANNAWENLYEFTKTPLKAIDFEPMNYYVSHEAQSIFVTNRICVLPTTKGWKILNNNKFKIIENQQTTVKHIASGLPYLTTLQKEFGIAMPIDTQFKLCDQSKSSWIPSPEDTKHEPLTPIPIQIHATSSTAKLFQLKTIDHGKPVLPTVTRLNTTQNQHAK